ncbi:MAG: RES family NAD+ phosphorylase [Bauldia sp.]
MLRPGRVPPPPVPLACHVEPAAFPFHRIFDGSLEPAQFNPGFGWSRFAPFEDSDGVSVPTMYGGTSFECAAAETLFHDIDPAACFKTLSKAKIDARTWALLQPRAELRLVTLFEPDFNRWGFSRTNLIDTPPSTYAATQRWVAAIHAAAPTAHGLVWTSRRHDGERCLMLFGDRVPSEDLAVVDHQPAPMTDRVSLYGQLQALARRSGITITL